MTLPPGFQLEQQPAAPGLPPGFQLETSEIPGERTFGGFASNVGTSAIKLPWSLVQAAMHPLDTATGMLDVGAGALQKALPQGLVDFVNKSETPEALAAGKRAVEAANMAGGDLKARYGSVNALRNTLYEDPVGAAADLSALFTGGGSAMARLTIAAPKLARVAAPVVRDAAGAVVDAARVAAPVVRDAAGAVVDAARATRVGQAIEAPIKARQAATQATNVANSYRNATSIEATQAANNMGIALNPAKSNPTVGNKLRSMLAGNNDVDSYLNAYNNGRWNDIVRQDLGVPDGRLNLATINKALDVAGKPNEPIRAIPQMVPSEEVISAIKAVEKPALIGGKAEANAVRGVIGDALDDLKMGPSGSTVLDSIRQLRHKAQTVYKSRDRGNNPSPSEVASADAQMGIANALEQMIDEYAPNAKVLNDMRAGRVRQAQIFDHERAINYATQKVDPQAYAKMLDERKGNMSGVGADIGKVAANSPEVSQASVKGSPGWQQNISRTGFGAAAGYLAASLTGGTMAPFILGGAAVGKVASSLAAKRMTSRAYQASHAVPTDYRPPVNNLRPGTSSTLNMLAPLPP